jgi:Na+-dependent transporters of the SNF family
LAETIVIAQGGAFNLGFAALPVIFQKIPLGQIFGGMFFFLLFIAGFTTSVALTHPIIAFLQDEFGWKREKAVRTVFPVLITMSAMVIAFF